MNKDRDKLCWWAIALLVVLNIIMLRHAVSWEQGFSQYYFLNIGQGDSELLQFSGNVKILIDAGSNKTILRALEGVLPWSDRYIDIVLITHPQKDHFGGLIELLDRYDIGLLITNGRVGTTKAYALLEEKISKKGIKKIVVKAGDRIAYGTVVMHILNPSNATLNNKEINESSIVILVEDNEMRSLFTGDIGIKTEELLRQQYDLDVDILKVAHHGSAYSSAAAFLNAVSPKVAVIEVGKNSYEHPTSETLQRLASTKATILRTDKDGTIRIQQEHGGLRVATIK